MLERGHNWVYLMYFGKLRDLSWGCHNAGAFSDVFIVFMKYCFEVLGEVLGYD